MTLNVSENSSFINNKSSQDIDKKLDHVWLLINNRQVKDATTACKKFNEEYKNNDDGWYATSFLAFQLKHYQQAIEAIDKSIKIAPKNPQWQLHKAHSLLMAGDQQQARTIANKLTSGEYKNVDFCAELALILNKLSNFDAAETIYQNAIDLLQDNDIEAHHKKAQLCFNLASIQRYQGKLEQAEATLNIAISINNNDHEAFLLRSSLRKQTNDENHIEELNSLLNKGIKHPVGKAQICYALAKENEDLARYQQSFVDLRLGAETRRKNMNYDINNDLKTIETISKSFTASSFSAIQDTENSPYLNNEAIFILGLPRTGSTLIERIISNHTDVHSAGELNNFALQMMAQVKEHVTTNKLQPPASKIDLVEITPHLNFPKLGEKYIESTRPDTGKTKYFVDKLPLNSLYSGLIHLALPQAKLIHVTRHPLDTCYAIYKQLFTHGYPFSYDLNELGQYYIAHHQLMQHWQKLMPDSLYQIAYEDVVSDHESQAKSLMAFCDIPWQEQCIDFQQNQAPSTTASASQVREKIYKTSQGKWLHYQEQLKPLKRQLEQAGICCD